MKTRSGFVSNSSSSSFIVAVKDLGEVSVQVTMRGSLNEYVDQEITTVEALTTYFIEEYGYTADELIEDENYQAAKRAILHEGKVVLIGSVSDQDGFSKVLCMEGIDQEDNPHIDVIQSEAGY